MRVLNIFLIAWLSVAVPTTATTAMVNADHCQRMLDSQEMVGMDHTQHTMQMHVAGVMSQSQLDQQNSKAENGCICGCNCFTSQCATGFSSLMGSLLPLSDFFNGAAAHVFRAQPGHLASAHLLELLRPPTLS